jgi:bifunctional DNA-binding transcriptional regulator/antitoxin component of YhaV-PrlF toxin-antitoxin module
MNMHVDIVDPTTVWIDADGMVRIPSDLLNRVGIVPGQPVMLGHNDQGELVIFQESPQERSDRIGQAIAAMAGRYDFGGSTDDYMAMIREPFEDTP